MPQKKTNARLKSDNQLLMSQRNEAREKLKEAERQIKSEQKKISDYEAEEKALKMELARVISINNNDGTNSSIPTSLTPLNKKKRIPNSRVKSNKHIGGQLNHAKHSLAGFEADEITDTVDHECMQSICPKCNAGLIDTGKRIEKDEFDIEVVVHKIRHMFQVMTCPDCGEEVHEPIPDVLKEKNQYGAGVRAMITSLSNTGNVPMNKVKTFLDGITNGEISPSEGYIA